VPHDVGLHDDFAGRLFGVLDEKTAQPPLSGPLSYLHLNTHRAVLRFDDDLTTSDRSEADRSQARMSFEIRLLGEGAGGG